MTTLEKRVLAKAYANLDMPTGRFRHFTFITKRSKIVSFGFNHIFKSHPLIKKFNYRFDSIHSEAHAVFSSLYKTELHRYKFYNVRINNLGEIALSAPCPSCQAFLASYGVREVYYTTNDGNFEMMELNF